VIKKEKGKNGGKQPKKRGRPHKSEGKREKQLSEMELQIESDPHDSLKKLDTACSFGCKKNSQGNVSLDPAKQERYKIRTTVERANSHLKDNLIPKALYVKGHSKVSFVLFVYSLLLSCVLASLKYLSFLC